MLQLLQRLDVGGRQRNHLRDFVGVLPVTIALPIDSHGWARLPLWRDPAIAIHPMRASG
jgi:hypothetical protein